MSLRRQVGRFALVGAGATVLHIASGSILIAIGIPQLVANLLAFLMAFGFSFMGHWGYTFAKEQVPLSRAFRRFVTVAAVGFVLNETVLALLLQVTDALVAALACAVLVAAAATFVLGRSWAFRPSPSGLLARTEDLP